MTSLFKSTFARKTFLLFMICALLPIMVLAALSLFTISGEIAENARREVQRSAKSVGLTIYDNLLIFESRLGLFALNPEEIPMERDSDRGSNITADYYFHRVGFLEESGQESGYEGWPRKELTDREKSHLVAGRSLLFQQEGRIYMMRKARSRIAIADLRTERLWEGYAPLYVFAPDGTILSGKRANFTIPHAAEKVSSQFEFEDGGRRYLAASRAVFLQGQFMSPPWKVFVTRSHAEVMQPVRRIKAVFALVFLLTFLLVALLSISLIRRNLAPIDLLREGTERIGEGDLGTRIDIRSGDEFEALGASFNRMTLKLQEMQSLLVHGERVKTIGQMSAAIVHEINQPLQAMLSYLEILHNRVDLPEEVKGKVGQLAATVDRLAAISQRFKRFARGSKEVEHAPLSVNSVLVSIEELLGHQLQKQRCTLSLRLQEGLPLVVGDSGELQQVFLNLIMNAMDAMNEQEERPGEERKANITVATSGANGRVTVTVEDTGPGIPDRVRERIFEPFFSTKEEGKGSGLGLAIAQTIVQRHHGTLECTGLDGGGSCFAVVLPAAIEGSAEASGIP